MSSLPIKVANDDLILEKFKILIIDDEPINIEILTEMLSDAGYYQITSTTEPEKSLELFHLYQPDLILLDLQMPTLHGLDVLKQLQQVDYNHTVPVMVLTADQNRASRLKALNLGAKDFITKPFDLEEITARIHNLLETRFSYRNLTHENKALDLVVQARARELHQEHRKLQKLNAELTTRFEQRTLELHKAESKLAHSQAAMFNLVSIVCDKFITPLDSIKNCVQILSDREQPISQETQVHYLSMMNHETDRLNSLVSNLLDLQKIDVGKMIWQPIEIGLSQLSTECIETLRPACADKNIEIHYKVCSERNTVIGDPQKLQQVIDNLLTNALKFTEHGSISISIERQECWANILLLSNDTNVINACKSISTSLNANLLHYTSTDSLVDHLRCSAGKAVLLLIQIESESLDKLVPLLTLIRQDLPHISIATIYRGTSRSGLVELDRVKQVQLDPLYDHDQLQTLIQDSLEIDTQNMMIQISVADTGTGIPEKQLNAIFLRSYLPDGSHPESSLRLALSREIIHYHQGRLWAQNNEAGGSTFTILIPEKQ